MFDFDGGILIPMMIFAIPIVAVAGGITAGIVRTISRHRLIELAQRERIAAIERGIDPTKLPPLPDLSGGDEDVATVYMSPRQATLKRARDLMTGGIVTLFAGIGIGVMLYFLADAGDSNAWAVGAIPAFVGFALLLSSWLVRRAANDDSPAPTPHR